MTPPLPISTGSLLSRAWAVFSAGPLVFLAINAVFVLPVLLVEVAASAGGNDAASAGLGCVSSLLELVLRSLAEGAIVFAVFRRLRSEPVGVGESLWKARAALLPLVGASLLQALATVGGLILLLIPGLVVLSATFVMIPALMVEELTVTEAWRRSWELTADHRVTIFGLWLTTFVIASVVMLPFMLPFINFEDLLKTDTKSPSFLVATAAANLVFGTFQTVLAGLTFHDLRLLKDDVGEEDLVAVFA